MVAVLPPSETEMDVLRQLRGLEGDEYDQVLLLISSFKRPLDVPPSQVEKEAS